MSDQPNASRRTRSERPTWVGTEPDEEDYRPPPLTRTRIVHAALRLVDEHGLTALTMRALATELKVSPMALYNHVRDKEELLDLTLDLMLGEVDCSPTEGDCLTQLRTLVCSFHETLSAHSHLARVYSAQVRIGPHGLRIIERALKLLLQAGLSRTDAAAAFQTLYTYTVGRHLVGRIAPNEAEYYDALPAGQIPSIREVSSHLGDVHRQELFEYGLDTLLAGLRTKLAMVGASLSSS